jgi:hypothetical protein
MKMSAAGFFPDREPSFPRVLPSAFSTKMVGFFFIDRSLGNAASGFGPSQRLCLWE